MLKATIFLLALGLTVGLKNDPECDVKLAARNCIKAGFLAGDDTFPRNDDDMNKLCTNVRLTEECSKKFMDKCAEHDKERKVLETTLNCPIPVMKRFCETEDRKKEFLKHNKDCGNAILKEYRDKCSKRFIRNLMVAAELDDKEKIRKIMCCKVRDMRPCLKELMDAKTECKDDNKRYIEDIRKRVADELTRADCADIEKDFDKKCAGVEVAEFRGEVDRESLAVATKKILDKIR